MISVLFSTESHYPVNRKSLKDGIIKSLETRVHRDAEVSIAIVGDRRMRALNKKFRNVDTTTDVLSFPQNDPGQPMKTSFVEVPDEVLRLGDIVISYPQTVKEAREQQNMVDDMLLLLALHGLDHLMGIHHE